MSIASTVHVAFIDNQQASEYVYTCTAMTAFEAVLNKAIADVVIVDVFNMVIGFKDGSSVYINKTQWAKYGFIMLHKDGPNCV